MSEIPLPEDSSPFSSRQGNTTKAYGAGLLSSFGELEYSCSPDRCLASELPSCSSSIFRRPAGGTNDRPEIRNWDPKEAGVTEFPITTYQPIYFIAQRSFSPPSIHLYFLGDVA